MKLCPKCDQPVAEEIPKCPSCGSSIVAGRKYIDDYRIVDILHEGHASFLCRAIRERTQELVMIRLFTDQAGVDAEVAARLEQELEELKKLPPDDFVRHYAIRLSSDGLWYRTSEWINSESWGSLLASGRLAELSACVDLFHRLARILSVLHKQGHIIPHLMELYLNDEFVDFTRSGDTGYYTFEIPLTYGNSRIELRFFGPWGEERTSTQLYKIPFTFLPPGETEYHVTLGDFHEEDHVAAGGFSLAHGFANRFSAGISGEALGADGNGSGQWHDLTATVSLNPASGLLTSAAVSLKGNRNLDVSYTSLAGVAADLEYAYHPENLDNQEARTELRGSVRPPPFKLGRVTGTGTLHAGWTQTDNKEELRTEAGISAFFGSFNAALKNELSWADTDGDLRNTVNRTLLTMGFPSYRRIRMRTELDYDHMENQLRSAGLNLERNIGALGKLAAGADYSFTTGESSISLTFSFDWSFARVRTSVRSSDSETSSSAGMSGSVGFSPVGGDVFVSNRDLRGTGGVSLVPFLDMDANGRQDPGEPPVENLEVTVRGARQVHVARNGVLHASGLPAYSWHRLTLSGEKFEQLTWLPAFREIDVFIDPGIYKTVEVPVHVTGELLGCIRKRVNGELRGTTGIAVVAEKTGGVFRKEEISMYDGEYYFSGLPPGTYRVYPDPEQLSQLSLQAVPEYRVVQIETLVDGDVKEGVSFELIRTTR